MGVVSAITGKAQPSASRVDERAGLRAAHARARDAKDALEAHRATIRRATELLAKAEAKAEKAAKGIEEARVAASQHVARAIARGQEDVDGDGLMRAARLQEASAMDHVESLRSALAQFKADTAEREEAVTRANTEVAAAVRSMIAPLARAALVKLKALDADTRPLLGLLRFAIESDGYRINMRPEDLPIELQLQKILDAPMADLQKEVADALSSRADMTDVYRIADLWKKAAADLRASPDAALPESK